MKKTTASLLLLLFLVSSFMHSTSAVQSEPRTIVVPDDYSSISAAVNNADPGDRIFVRQGTYIESTLNLTKPLEITGENASSTTIIFNPALIFGGYTGVAADFFFGTSMVIDADKITLSGLTIKYDDSKVPTEHILHNGVYSGGYVLHGGGSVIVNGNDENITGNVFTNTPFVVYGSNSSISSNTFQTIVSVDGLNNKLYHNNFVGGYFVQGYGYDEEVYATSGSINVWDDGYPSGGNYWGNYTTEKLNGTMLDHSGIGNKPYAIDSQNKDNYPLLEPFNDSFLANYFEEVTPPKLSILSPGNKTYLNATVPLVFTSDKPVNWAGYCLDGQRNVTINGNTTISNMAYSLHSLTIYANSTFGIIGVSKTIDFTVVKSELYTYILIASVTTLAIAIGLTTALLYYRRQRAPSPTPSIPELSWLMIVPLFLLVFSVAMIIRYGKAKHG